MSRISLKTHVPENLAEAIRRVAAFKDRSISDIIEGALLQHFSEGHGGHTEHAALMAKLEAHSRRLVSIEKSLETLFELTAHAARFTMSIAPEIPESDRAALNARGAERFGSVINAILKRLGNHRSLWRDHFAGGERQPQHASAPQEASQNTTQTTALASMRASQ